MSIESSPPVIVGIGEILWDLLPGGRKLGGAPANFAYHATALGAVGIIVSRVGDGDLGRETLGRLDAIGLDRRYIGVDPAHPTGTVDVTLGAGGEPQYTIHSGVAWDFLSFSTELQQLAARADAVCFGTLAQRNIESRRTIAKFLALLRPQCLKVFDINLRQKFYDRSVIHELLMLADVLKLNEKELAVLTELLAIGGSGVEAVNNIMSRYPLKLVALTLGAAGSRLQGIGEYAVDPGASLESSAIADTVGAGDAFAAGLVVGLLRGRPLQQVNAFANRLAAYVCTQSGAMPSIPPEFRAAMAIGGANSAA